MSYADRTFQQFVHAASITPDAAGKLIIEFQLDPGIMPLAVGDLFEWVTEYAGRRDLPQDETERLLRAAGSIWGRYQRFAAGAGPE